MYDHSLHTQLVLSNFHIIVSFAKHKIKIPFQHWTCNTSAMKSPGPTLAHCSVVYNSNAISKENPINEGSLYRSTKFAYFAFTITIRQSHF